MLTIAIMAVTVYLASRKPVRVAERISVMEALGYQTSKTVYTGKKKRTGKILFTGWHGSSFAG